MAKLVWRLKLVAERHPGVATETELACIERDEAVGLAVLSGLMPEPWSGGDRREIGGATGVGYVRVRSLTEGGCVAWVLRLVEISAEGERPCADVMEIRRPDRGKDTKVL